MSERSVETKRGLKVRVHEWGSGAPLFFLHGAGGLFPQEPMLEKLGRHFHVYASEWPGYGEEKTETALEDMLDFALHGWDVVEALGLERPHLVGHSMGGMIAAEMACLAPRQVDKLVLIGSAGLWLDAHPIPDIFAMLPFELADVLFANPAEGVKLMTGGVDFTDPKVLTGFLVTNARRLGTAGKILFPIPNRRVSKRLYRQTRPTLLLWGAQDKLIPTVYGERWKELLPDARLALVQNAGHMLPQEQPEAAAAEIERFLRP